MAILAIDQGTSGTKAILLEGATVISRGVAEIDVSHLPNGHVECDPHLLWKSIVDSVGQALACREAKSVVISAVSLANQGESVLVWDRKTLEPKSPILVWQDSRSADLCAERSKFSSEIREISGLENDPYFVAPKIRWLKDKYPSGFEITTLDTWIIAKLTNNFVTDISTASRSMLFNLNTGKWDAKLIEIWELDDQKMPEVLNNDAVVGEINSPDLPNLKGVPLAGLIVDQAAALLAENCLELGEAKCTYGTGAFLLCNIGNIAKVSGNRLATSFAWQVSDGKRYYEDGQVFTVGSAVDWLINNKLLDSVHEIDKLSIETNGVFAVPGFAGYGAPRWKPNGTASITGLSLGSTRNEVARAVLNGIAAQVTELIEVIAKDGSQIRQMRVDGGLTQSKTLMQFQADLAQVEIELFPHPDATAVGVGVLGTIAIDKSASLKSALPQVKSAISYEPNWSKDRAEEFMNEWRTRTSRGNE